MSEPRPTPAAHEPTLTIAFDGGPLLGPITGVGAAVQNMAASLAERDDVVLSTYACSFRGDLLPGMRRLPIPAAVAQRFWEQGGIPRVDHWLKPASVVHGTNYVVPPSRLPRLVTVYDCWFLRHPELATPAVGRAARVLRRAVSSGAMVHTSSHATAQAVRELLATDRVEVVALAPLPIDTAPSMDQHGASHPAPIAQLDGAPFVLALGTTERRKNIPRLVHAFGRIAGAQPDLHLVIAGAPGDDQAKIDEAIASLDASVRGRVVITGRIESTTKSWLLSNATVLAYPSLDEGFGFPLLEAMQHLVPVVASTAGSIPEVAGDAALLVAPSDTDALADALPRAITDESLRETLVAAGQTRLGAYSWTDTATGLVALYRRLVQEGT